MSAPPIGSNPVAATAAQLAALAATVPIMATSTPAPESTGGAAGIVPNVYSDGGHSHPRLTSVGPVVLDANGLATATFSQQFDAEPGVVLTAINPGGTQPVMLQVQSWVMDANGKYAGCVIKGYRGQTLPASIALLTVLVSFNVNGGSAAGVRVSVIAVKSSF